MPHPHPPEPLNYATLPPRLPPDRDGCTGGCLGRLILLPGLLFLSLGLLTLLRGMRRPNRFLPSDDLTTGLIALAIGLVCLLAAFRWTRPDK